MSKKGELKAAWKGIKASRDKQEMARVRSTSWVACLSKNHPRVMNSKRFYLI
jgi:hypothetical protein